MKETTTAQEQGNCARGQDLEFVRVAGEHAAHIKITVGELKFLAMLGSLKYAGRTHLEESNLQLGIDSGQHEDTISRVLKRLVNRGCIRVTYQRCRDHPRVIEVLFTLKGKAEPPSTVGEVPGQGRRSAGAAPATRRGRVGDAPGQGRLPIVDSPPIVAPASPPAELNSERERERHEEDEDSESSSSSSVSLSQEEAQDRDHATRSAAIVLGSREVARLQVEELTRQGHESLVIEQAFLLAGEKGQGLKYARGILANWKREGGISGPALTRLQKTSLARYEAAKRERRP